MTDALKTLLPMFAFMLLPLWIPMIAVAVDQVAEAISAVRAHRGMDLRVLSTSSSQRRVGS